MSWLVPDTRVARTGAVAALVTMAGIIVSGPLALAIVLATHPQPPWAGAAQFVERHHLVQSLPFLGGFVLVGGLVMLVASVHVLAVRPLRARTTGALVFTAAFAALVFFNYIVQTTFVPELVRGATPSDEPLIAALTMANPSSLAWAIEMWAYALLGVATWLVAPVFHRDRLERATSWTFVANGAVSVAGAILTVLLPGWAMSTAGLVAFAVWNALILAMAALAYVALRRRAV